MTRTYFYASLTFAFVVSLGSIALGGVVAVASAKPVEHADGIACSRHYYTPPERPEGLCSDLLVCTTGEGSAERVWWQPRPRGRSPARRFPAEGCRMLDFRCQERAVSDAITYVCPARGAE